METDYPKHIVEKIARENQALDDYLLAFKKNHDDTKALFLITEPFSLANNVYGVNWLSLIYFNLCFYPDDEIFKKFEDFGVKRSALRWMDGIHVYLDCFEEMEKEVAFYKMEFMQHLYVHLMIHISLDVFEWADFRRTDNFNLSTDLKNAFERFEYNAFNPTKEYKTEMQFRSMIKDVTELQSNRIVTKTDIFRLLKGQVTKSFYSSWIQDSFPYKSEVLKSNDFLNRIVPLFKLILKKQKWPDPLDPDKYLGKGEGVVYGQFLRRQLFKA
jgi:hypothetical protein